MKKLVTLALAIFAVAPAFCDEKKTEEQVALPKGAELVAELNGHGYDFIFFTNKKNGNALVYRVKRLKVEELDEAEKAKLKKTSESDTRETGSPLFPGGVNSLVYLSTINLLLPGRAEAVCRSVANGRGFFAYYLQGAPGAYHCYGQITYAPVPVPAPYPYGPIYFGNDERH